MDNLNQLQADIISKGLLENPLLRSHVIPILNNQLNTIQKDSIIKAINEIFTRVTTMDKSLNTFMGELLEIIGNWKNNPDLKENLDLMAGNLIESILYLNSVVGEEGLKRTVVFYIQNFWGVEKSVNIFVPYKGKLKKLYVSIPEPSDTDLGCRFTMGSIVEDITLSAGDRMISIDLEGSFDNTNCIFTILTGGEGLEGINASLDFIQVN